jgi:hypoxanthine phosphoribosyltransferase
MTAGLPPECERVVLTESQIAERVRELGAEITARHGGEPLRLVTVLRGSLFFLADLCRAIDCELTLDFLAVAPYVHGQGGSVRMTKDLDDDIGGSRVILVEDVVDTGLTVNYVLSFLREHGPAALEICTLLDKPARRIVPVPIDYTGFSMSDRFLVGYGLDLAGRYRNLRYIAELRPETALGDPTVSRVESALPTRYPV